MGNSRDEQGVPDQSSSSLAVQSPRCLPGSSQPAKTTQHSQATQRSLLQKTTFYTKKESETWQRRRAARAIWNSLRLELPVSTAVQVPLHLERVGRSSIQVLSPTCRFATTHFQNYYLSQFKPQREETGSIGHTAGLPTWSLLGSVGTCLRHCRHLHGSKHLSKKHLAHRAYTEATSTQGHFAKTGRDGYFV